MHKPESFLENETHVILWNFEKLTDHSIPARRPDLVLINKKKNATFSGFCCSGRSQSENKKIDRYLDLARKLKKLWKFKVMVIQILVGVPEMLPKSLEKKPGVIGDQKNWDYTNYSIIMISKNT